MAAAGIGLSGLQPPGSTFKIITLAGVLEQKVATQRTKFPVETATTLEGVRLENANAESCGGTLVDSFAHSCNTVFAPLGAKLGAERLVDVAERFGFNQPPGIPGAATSAIPPAGEIGDDLAVGSTAIGQGRVQATTLQMAIAAATVAARGRRPIPTLRAGARPRHVDAIPREVARRIARSMRAVVQEGTGTAAALPGVKVAGKTGTAELASTVPAPGTDGVPAPAEAETPETTAWFSAYAPTRRPRVAVSVMLVEAGAGGEVAAPAAKALLQAGLRRRA
jgi:cell division protein FtsI/penicillin-binding protein 2